MLPRYLLDTNILSDIIKRPDGAVARKILGLEDERLVCTSVVVACELRYGALKKNSKVLIQRVEQLLSVISVLPVEANVSDEYARLRTLLEKAGTPIGGNDLLIAAHAKSLNLIMVTANVKEFARIPGLPVENWLHSILDQ